MRSSPLLPLAALLWLLPLLACLTPPPPAASAATGSTAAGARSPQKMAELDAWSAARRMSPGINIGNTLENTSAWETGWGKPRITKELLSQMLQQLAPPAPPATASRPASASQ